MNHLVRVTVVAVFGLLSAIVWAGPDSGAGEMLNLDQARSYMVVLINRDRQSQGLGTVTLDMTASRAAQSHADDMVEFGYLSHWGRDGKKPDQRYTEGDGADVDSENADYYWEGDVEADSPRQLTKASQPTFSRARIEAIEAGLFNEQPPLDGHRRNILDPHHNRVGIALSIATEGDFSRIACTQEFINSYGHYADVPRSLQRGNAFAVNGALAAGYHIQSILLREEGLPQPMSLAELAKTYAYSVPDKIFKDYFPGSEPDSVITTEAPAGETFTVRVATQSTWPTGLYYVEIWAQKPGGEAFRVSERTLVVSNQTNQTAGTTAPLPAIPPSNAIKWSSWLDATVQGESTLLHSRKGCHLDGKATATHQWEVQFANDDPTNSYNVIFQLVPPAIVSLPADWPTNALAVTVLPASLHASPSSGAFSIATDCNAVPHIFYSIRKVVSSP